MGAWAIWACLSLAGIGFVAVYSLRFPFGDEWQWIGKATGDEPLTLSWLWSQHNEHRMFLPRLIYLGLGALSGFDFRAGAFFNVLVLSSLSLAMMTSVCVLRGKTRLYDAFFPLLLLHWGQAENLIWGFQLNFVTAVFLEGLILLMVLRCGNRVSLRSFTLVAVCLVLLGLMRDVWTGFPPAYGVLAVVCLGMQVAKRRSRRQTRCRDNVFVCPHAGGICSTLFTRPAKRSFPARYLSRMPHGHRVYQFRHRPGGQGNVAPFRFDHPYRLWNHCAPVPDCFSQSTGPARACGGFFNVLCRNRPISRGYRIGSGLYRSYGRV